MTYDELLAIADNEGIDVIPHAFISERIKGLYCDNTIALDKNLETSTAKACILAEELGHYYTSSGDIIDLSSVSNRKQEYRARLWSYNNQVGLYGIISAYKAKCDSAYEIAEYLGVTEDFLQATLSCYRSKYGVCTSIDNYIIYFEPTLGVFELVND